MKAEQREFINRIPTETVLSCPVCGSEGRLVFHNCQDKICGLSGSWSIKRCKACQSLWIDPRPTRDQIPSLYPENYLFTHSQPQEPLQEPTSLLGKLRFATKLAILEQAFGYQELSQRSSSFPGIALGRCLSILPNFKQWAGYMIRFLPSQPNGRLLEVGTGNGGFLWLMDHLGWQVEGIEPDSQAAQAAAATGLTIMSCGLEEANLQPSSYDAIVLHHVMEHFPEPKQAVKKLIDSLKPGGVLVSISPNPVGIIAKLFGANWYELDAPRHLTIPSPKGYQKLFEGTQTKVQVSTTMQTGFWMYRESLSLQKTGQVGQHQGTVLPKLASALSSVLLPLFPSIGEEVICYVTKI